MKPNIFGEEEEFLLNGSARTIDRIDRIIRLVSHHYYEDDIILYRKALIDLWIQGQGWIKDKKKYSKGHYMINQIILMDIKVDESEYNINYDQKLPNALLQFHTWFLHELHKVGATMGTKPGTYSGLGNLVNRLGLKNETNSKDKPA